MSAAPDPFAPVREAIWVKERGNIVPAFYVAEPHTHPDATVVKDKDGEPFLPVFTVADVPIERRL